MEREQWASRIGLVLAMAGNAIGLGNFLRFPVKAAQNGGGAFMIPYFLALILLGVPLMWVEWGLGRYGGHHATSTAPGVFRVIWKGKLSRLLGALGIALPLSFVIYYVYIESWTLAYSFFSFTGKYFDVETRSAIRTFHETFLGRGVSDWFGGIGTAYTFFLITMILNTYILARGVVRGIETLAKIAMPLLFLFAVVLAVRVLTLGAPDPKLPEQTAWAGMAFVWTPNFGELRNGSVWLAAAGQIFFTLSVGTASILTYASYLREKDDLVLNGLATSSTNEFAEVILGGSIAIPAAVAFFGLAETQEIAKGGAFDLGFNAMPLVFHKMFLGQLFGGLWFVLLFFAGITSSVALSQPAVAFLQEQYGMSRERAAILTGALIFVCCQPVIFFLGHGYLDEMDFWAGTFGLVVFALVECILFAWVFGMDNAWAEITKGAELRLPRVFYYIIKYITPAYLLILLVAWFWQDGMDVLLMRRAKPEDRIFLWGARLVMLILWLGAYKIAGTTDGDEKEPRRP